MTAAKKSSWIPMLSGVGLLALATYGASAAIMGSPAVVADGICYNTAAARLLNTKIYSYLSLDINSIEPPNAFITPGYILVLAALYLFSGHTGETYTTLANAIPLVSGVYFVCAVLTAVSISAAGRLVGGARLGWVAGILAALYLPFGAEAMSGWPENLSLLTSTVCLLLAIKVLLSNENAGRWMLAFGVCGGVAAMMRPVMSLWLVFPIVLWGWTHRGDVRKALRVMALGVAGIALVMTPWIARNAIVLGKFIPLTTHAGTVWIDGVGGTKMTQREQRIYQAAVSQGRDGYKEVAFVRLRAKWKSSPAKFLMWKATNAYELVSEPWSSRENPSFPLAPDVPKVVRPDYRLMSVSGYATWILLIRVIHVTVLVLGVLGIALLWRRPIIWLLVSMPAYLLVVHTIMMSWNRYFYSAMPSMLLLAGIAVTCVWSMAEKRTRDFRTRTVTSSA